MFAVLLALQHDDRKMEVRTDSQWVFNGAVSWNTWRQCGWTGDHSDLWNALSTILAARRSPVRFVKVLGHVTAEDL